MLAVVSLYKNDHVEVRSCRPRRIAAGREHDRDAFALFASTAATNAVRVLSRMLVLGIETSCDETAAAVVDETGRVLSDVVHSQVAVHAPYGGVVPELASRDHLRNARPVVAEALAQARRRASQTLDGVAVTCRPGLTGALLVGVQIAQGLAWAAGKPIVGVDHLIGHLCAVFLRRAGEPLRRAAGAAVRRAPRLGRAHGALSRRRPRRRPRSASSARRATTPPARRSTRSRKLLGLGYPGGPVIDRLAREGDPRGAFASRRRCRSATRSSSASPASRRTSRAGSKPTARRRRPGARAISAPPSSTASSTCSFAEDDRRRTPRRRADDRARRRRRGEPRAPRAHGGRRRAPRDPRRRPEPRELHRQRRDDRPRRPPTPRAPRRRHAPSRDQPLDDLAERDAEGARETGGGLSDALTAVWGKGNGLRDDWREEEVRHCGSGVGRSASAVKVPASGIGREPRRAGRVGKIGRLRYCHP